MKIRDRIKEFRRVPAGDLLPNPRNWRKHPKAQAEALQGILAEIGFAGAVLARETENGLMLIDGHLRVETAGTTEIPVLILDVTAEEADKILATFDPLGAMATTDATKLKDILETIQTDNQALATMLSELAIDSGIAKTKEITEDEIPEPPIIPITKSGDLWLLGNHRVLCGDSTNNENINRLMLGTKPNCVLTDPPYGIGSLMEGGSWAKKNDSQFLLMREWDEKTYQKFFDMIDSLKIPSIVWGGNYFQTPPSRCWLVWNKPEFPSVSSAELAWTNIDANTKRIECVRTHQAGDGKKQHATQKPVKVMAWSLEFVPNGIVYDPFLGSGTTLIASEQLGRTCYGIEIEPMYCDIVIQRWESLTGKKAVLESRVQL